VVGLGTYRNVPVSVGDAADELEDDVVLGIKDTRVLADAHVPEVPGAEVDPGAPGAVVEAGRHDAGVLADAAHQDYLATEAVIDEAPYDLLTRLGGIGVFTDTE